MSGPTLSRPAFTVLRSLSRGLPASHVVRSSRCLRTATPALSSSERRRLFAERPILSRLAVGARYNSTIAQPEAKDQQIQPSDQSAEEPSSQQEAQSAKPEEPQYAITFTCRPCKNRSEHRITKHGYHRGTILITCPSCSARHIISDHLKIFKDQHVDVEGLLKKKGELVKRGSLAANGDIELWDEESYYRRPTLPEHSVE